MSAEGQRGRSEQPMGVTETIMNLIPKGQMTSVRMNLARCHWQDREDALQEAAVAVLEGVITPAGAIATFQSSQARHRSRQTPISQLNRRGRGRSFGDMTANR